jgi:uncharacterized protein (DUF1330 family)
MPAYVIAYLEITDPKRFDEYRRLAGPTFAPYGGKPIVVDGRMEILEGMIHPKSVVVIEFESFDQAKREGLAPRVGLEPTTLRLTAGCSTIELSGNAEPGS